MYFIYLYLARKGFIHEPEIEPIQFGLKKMNPILLEMLIQPNPTLIVRVGLDRVVRVECTPLLVGIEKYGTKSNSSKFSDLFKNIVSGFNSGRKCKKFVSAISTINTREMYDLFIITTQRIEKHKCLRFSCSKDLSPQVFIYV